MRTQLPYLIALLAFTTLPALAREPDKTPLVLGDLFKLDAPLATALAPDLSKLAYSRRWVDRAQGERLSLWIVDGAGSEPRALEAFEPDARLPVFSPDGQWIAIRSTRARPANWEPTPTAPLYSEPATDIWLVSTDGRRVLPLAGPEKPYGRVFSDPFYARVAFSPDGQWLVFVADAGVDPRTMQERDANVVRVRADQGEGYTSYGPAQIWLAELDLTQSTHAAKNVRRLTDDETWYADPQWTPDGRHLICVANKSEATESARFSINQDFNLWRLDATTGEQSQLTTNPGPDVSPRVSPDGTQLVYLTVPRRGPHSDVYNLATRSLTSDPRQTRVLYDHHQPASNSPPHPTPNNPLPDDCWDGPGALVYSGVGGIDNQTVRLDLATLLATPFKPSADETTPTPAAQRQLARTRLAPPNNAITNERHLGEERRFQWSNEGLALDGLITLPPATIAKPPYAVIVYPHGGPHSRSSRGFNFTVQYFAAQGYLVFNPNFRGSTGYTREFLDADKADFGGGDMRDILSGVEALAAAGLVDRARQFVYGTSYGGFMTTWLVGHTQQFKAAVAQNPVTDLSAMWGVGDLQSWIEYEFGDRPWNIPDKLREHSPTAYLGQVSTPTLLLHAANDRRCPIAMSTMFYRGLQARGVPSQMIVYPDENHGIRQPRHMADVLRRVTGWFRRFDPTQNVEIVTLGDSITKAARPGVRRDETFAARLEETLAEREYPVRVTNVGIGGERTDQALARLEKDVLARQPRIVTIMYGTNDSYVDKGKNASRITVDEYRANLELLVKRLRAANIEPVLMTEPRWGASAGLNGAGEHPNVRLEQYVAACRAVAQEMNVPLVDHYAHWLAAEQAGQVLGAWTTDQCHPNSQGQRILMETMLPVLEPLVQRLATEPRR